ncbi:MAG TPA: PaaI family thioesterase [Thermoanaerobaculia bacterium]|nr:PaaI family thioesterase [Thermoanaerobaculia bacterium]
MAPPADDLPTQSLQERFFPEGRCFGCGPANEKGLRIRSFETAPAADAEVVCDWTPERHHEAAAGLLNGGIAGALMDCHGNWTAAHHLMRRDGLDRPPTTVTGDFHVRLKKPTPSDRPLRISARAVSSEGRKVKVAVEISAGGEVTATCDAIYLAVKADHLAAGRW